MYSDKILNDLKRLKFEDCLWIIFSILCIANIYGDYNDKEYLITNDKNYQTKSNYIF